MKFTVSIVVMLAFAVIGSNSSIIPWGPTLITSGHLAAPLALQLQPIAHPAQIITSIQSAPAAAPLISLAGHGQIIAGHGPAIIAGPVEATSVSKTRGAIHVAPLPGHAQSVAQLNLQPAPGTL